MKSKSGLTRSPTRGRRGLRPLSLARKDKGMSKPGKRLIVLPKFVKAKLKIT